MHNQRKHASSQEEKISRDSVSIFSYEVTLTVWGDAHSATSNRDALSYSNIKVTEESTQRREIDNIFPAQ